MPKKIPSKTKIKVEKKQSKNSIWDIFNFGESYTSLFLGIIVVIIATILLLTFAKGKNISGKSELSTQIKQVQSTPIPTISGTKPTKTQIVLNNKQKPTITVTKKEIKPTITEKKQVSTKNNQVITGSIYTVIQGDTLWNIAENKYNSGYRWVDIQKANNLTNPDLLLVGTKLILPKVDQKITTITKEDITTQPKGGTIQANKISGTSYIVTKGDNLWNIAVRAYGDGYAWTKISNANKLSNPNLIHSGNKLTIPRG